MLSLTEERVEAERVVFELGKAADAMDVNAKRWNAVRDALIVLESLTLAAVALAWWRGALAKEWLVACLTIVAFENWVHVNAVRCELRAHKARVWASLKMNAVVTQALSAVAHGHEQSDGRHG